MRKHNGMRPQDIVILLKIIAINNNNWQLKNLATLLHLSASEVSESLNRSRVAGLIDYKKEKIKRQSLMEFIEHGLHYVFPQAPGTIVNGIPTAHSHPFMKQYFDSELMYVWNDFKGKEKGLAIEPLYPKQVDAIKHDEVLYKMLALVDVIRVGKTREIAVAVKELNKMIIDGLLD